VSESIVKENVAGKYIEEGAEEAPSFEEGEFNTFGVVTVSLGHTVHDTYTGFLNPLLPTFKETMSLSNTQAGLLTVFMQWPSLFQPFLGHMADRFNLRYFFIFAPALTAAMMSLLGIAPSYMVMAMFLVVTGLGSASLHAVGPAIIGRLSGEKLGLGTGLWMVGGELARALGPLVIVAAVQFMGLQGTPWLMIAGILASILIWIQLRDVPVAPANDGASALPWRDALRQMTPILPALTAVVITRSFSSASLSTYLPILLTDQGASKVFAGISLSVYQTAGIAGALLGGTLSDKLGRRIILVLSALTTPLLMLIFTTAGTMPVQVALLLALGLTSLSVIPVTMALVQDVCPDNRALATGIFMAMSFLIRSLVVVILGALGDRFNTQTSFTISAIVALLGVPFIFLLPNRKQRAA
jgi:FSR family fosmidomycin resistance protein-like MFS transporter